MASTYPSDVAQAVEWAYAHRQFEGDAAVQAVQNKPWDPSVQSLVAFPQVLAMLGENPQWVRELGDALLAQPGDVMDSVQFLRAKAKDAGNLVSNEQQLITIEPAPPPPQIVVVTAPPPPTQIIVIAPANPRVVFVPIFNPLWAFGPWWHPAFPPFFFPPPPRWGWGWSSAARAGFWWGVGIGVSNSLWGGVDWRQRDVNINVNRWNTINVNHRIDSRDRDVSWRHNVDNRHGVPYRGTATRDRLQRSVGDVRARDDYRGRELQRERARDELANRVGAQNLDRNALRDIDRSQLPQRPVAPIHSGNVRDRAAGVDRGQLQERAATVDRAQLQPRCNCRQGAIGRPRRGHRPWTATEPRRQCRSCAIAEPRGHRRPCSRHRPRPGPEPCRKFRSCAGARPRGQAFDRSHMQNRNASAAAVNRDNALRDAGNAAQTRQLIDRGAASQAAMQQRASGASGGAAARRQ